jgi:hypothetical protein
MKIQFEEIIGYLAVRFTGAGTVEKVATVGRPDQIDSRRFGEMVAQNRWVNARIFTNAEDAAK